MAQEMPHKLWFQSSATASQIDRHKTFSTCQTSQGLQITVGDYVHIKHRPNDPRVVLYIARVERLYKDNGGTWFLHARWYYRPEDLRHQPPSCPEKQEVYYTDYIDYMLVDYIAGHCKVIIKSDFLRLNTNERSSDSNATTKDATYFWEFTYSAEKGAFSSLNRSNHECQSDSLASFKHLGGSSTVRGTATVAKELAEVLLDVETKIPQENLPNSWADSREAWIYKTTTAKTIKEVAHSLLELEEGVRVLFNAPNSKSTKDHAAWRKTVSGIHTYDQLAKYVKLYKEDVQHLMMSSMCNVSKVTRGIHRDHGLIKRKHIPETRPKKLQRVDCTTGAVSESGPSTSSFRDDLYFTSSQTEARPVSAEITPVPLSSKCEIQAGSVYQISMKFLPVETPASLKFMRAVLVAERTRLHVKVKFPSIASLQTYFGRTPEVTMEDFTNPTTPKSLVEHIEAKKETRMGTTPLLDDYFILTPKGAEKVLSKSVSGIEYLHQAHLWSFWVSEDTQLSSDKGTDRAESEYNDIEDDAKGELGAAEALTQLIPANTTIVSPNGDRVATDRSQEHGIVGPFKSRIIRGHRSLRRASFGNRSSSGTSPISCETGIKDLNNKDREKTLSRKSLDYPDQELHQQVGQGRITHDFMQTERSSRINSRREEKFMDLGAGAIKIPSKDKSAISNSRQIRSNNILKQLPKEMKGRWASERYKCAQLKLIDIMHERGAVPGKPILRPVLREEARKDIGDTGLLDHLLKHMTDTVVTNGERFRRRHNAAGAMEYWLEDASFMELRDAAGIDDPFWIPPPGWKPGDALPGRGGYGYVSNGLNRGLTPAEAAEMKKLKETFNKLNSILHSLSSMVMRSNSREVTPETKEFPGLQEIVTENCSVIQSNIEFEENVRDTATLHRSTMEGMGVRGEFQNVQDDQNPEQSRHNLISDLLFQKKDGTLEGDLSAMQQSVNLLLEEHIPCIMGYIKTTVGFSQSEANGVKLTLNQVDGGATTSTQVPSIAIEPKSLSNFRPGQNRTLPTGFQVYKPPGGRSLVTRLVPPAVNTSSDLGNSMVISHEDASVRVSYNHGKTGVHDNNQLRPSWAHHMYFVSQASESVVDTRSQFTSPHFLERNGLSRMPAERTHIQSKGFHQPAYQSDVLKLADDGRGATQAPARDGLTILSVAAGCEANNDCAGDGNAQNRQDTLQNPLPTMEKYCVASSPPSLALLQPAVASYPDPRMCTTLLCDTNHLAMRSVTSSDRRRSCTGLPYSSQFVAAKCHRNESTKSSGILLNDHPFEGTLEKSNPISGSKAEHPMRIAVAKGVPGAIVNVGQDPSTNLSLASHMSPGSTCSSSKSAYGCDLEPTSVISSLVAVQAGRSYSREMLSGFPLHQSANQLQSLRQGTKQGLEQPHAEKNFSDGLRSSMQSHDAAREKCSIQSTSAKTKGSSLLDLRLAPPTPSNLHS